MATPADRFLQSKVRPVELLLDLEFTNRILIAEALSAPGSYEMPLGRFPSGNKRLAVLGDTVLELLILEDAYHAGESRGEMNQILQRISCNRNLEHKGFAKGLDAHIIKNPSQSGQISPALMQDTMEALIGAAYLDGGLTMARIVKSSLDLV